MFTRLGSLPILCSLLWLVAGAPNTNVVHSLDRRTCPEQPILYASFVAGCNDCKCPIDLNGDSGVLINVFPGYQCAYPAGPCMWSDTTGALQRAGQPNCPLSAPCGPNGCTCPVDNAGAYGLLMHHFTGYQCAYPGGACTWNYNGTLQNTAQTNCPTCAKCNHLGLAF